MSTATTTPVRAQSHWGTPDHQDPRLIEGYARQRRQRDERLRAGAAVVGVKVGANDPATQQRLGLRGPLTGFVTSTGVFDADAPIAVGDCTLAGVEPELGILDLHFVAEEQHGS